MKAMREDLRRQVHQATEAEFRHMLGDGEISFRLEASGDPQTQLGVGRDLRVRR